MSVAEFKNMRKAWTKARDKAKVGSGAVKGVSMGDAIDAIPKAAAKSYGALETALNNLLKDIKTYTAKMSAKKDLVAWLKTNVEKPAEDLIKDIRKDLDTFEDIIDTLKKRLNSKAAYIPENFTKNIMEEVSKAEAAGKSLKACGGKMTESALAYGEFFGDVGNRVKTLSVKVKLEPLADGVVKDLKEGAESLLWVAKAMAEFGSVKDTMGLRMVIANTRDADQTVDVGYLRIMNALIAAKK